ncbi:DUF5667 domain-containing protein [Nocardioides plantarum]|uniref:DUF5667 domain-containing protein n=1 Tax=Nocardioides plantarum TaxID=29299 RepID=A0ABV5KAN5_9ACTN|nr:DUF5667 domain-containing protein [Nocardioides plantarum]
MNPVLPAHRRAAQFSSLVEASSTTQPDATGPHADLLPLVDLVTVLRSTPTVEPRPEFVAALRERLLLAAETALVPDTPARAEARRQPTPRRTARERRVAAAIGGFALVSATASMSVAAQNALPGDTLYPLKRAIESLHETVLRSADDKGATMLDNASGRLDEVDELSRSGDQDSDTISRTLRDFSDQAADASDVLLGDYEQTGQPSSVAELRTFTATSLDVLQRLESLVPAQVRPVLDRAAAVLDEIDRRARALCPACSTLPAAAQVSAAADLGPLDRLLDEVVTKPASATTPPRSDSPDTEQPPTSAVDPTPPTTPASPPTSTPTTEPPDPTPDDTDPSTPPGPRPSLGAVVDGLDPLDLGNVLTGVTEELTEGLDGVLGGTESD